jgi:hypothetical protein
VRPLTIERGYTELGTFGTLTVRPDYGPEWECETVERPWINNEPNISCIPEGRYRIRRTRYNKGNAGAGYPAFEILDVTGRSLIKIHVANWPHDVEGCVGVGDKQAVIYDKRDGNSYAGVTSSGNTHTAFMGVMDGVDEADLIITHRTAV